MCTIIINYRPEELSSPLWQSQVKSNTKRFNLDAYGLFLCPPKAKLPERKLVIVVIRETQQYLLTFINFNLSVAVCVLLTPRFSKLTLSSGDLNGGFSLAVAATLFAPLSHFLLTLSETHLPALMRDSYLCQTTRGSCFVRMPWEC